METEEQIYLVAIGKAIERGYSEVSQIQRDHRLAYPTAKRLFNQMQDDGIIDKDWSDTMPGFAVTDKGRWLKRLVADIAEAFGDVTQESKIASIRLGLGLKQYVDGVMTKEEYEQWFKKAVYDGVLP